MFNNSQLRVSIPVRDKDRAKRFYAEKLELSDAHENDFSITFPSGGGFVSLTYSESAGQSAYSLLTWVVEDIHAVVDQLREKDVVFEEFEVPGTEMENHIADFGGDLVAWFKDSEGNMLAVAQLADRGE